MITAESVRRAALLQSMRIDPGVGCPLSVMLMHVVGVFVVALATMSATPAHSVLLFGCHCSYISWPAAHVTRKLPESPLATTAEESQDTTHTRASES